jgi:hypothetical protein
MPISFSGQIINLLAALLLLIILAHAQSSVGLTLWETPFAVLGIHTDFILET